MLNMLSSIFSDRIRDVHSKDKAYKEGASMKRKYLALLLILSLCLSLLAGCSTSDDTDTDSSEESSDVSQEDVESTETETVYGEITAIDGTSITVNVGTLNTTEMDNEPSEDASSDESVSADESSEDTGSSATDEAADDASSSETQDAEGGEIPEGGEGADMSGFDASSMIELSDETLTVATDENTSFVSQTVSMSGSGMAGNGGGDMEAGGEIPSDGEAPDGGEGSFSDGDLSNGGEGEAPESGGDETAESSGTNGESSSSTADTSDGSAAANADEEESTPEDVPSGDGSVPEDAPSGGDDVSGDAPSDGSGEDGTAPEDADEMEIEATEITIDDLAVGDIISIEYDEEGSVSVITLLYDSDSVSGAGAEMTGGAEGMGSSSSNADITYTAVTEITEDTTLDGETISSTGTDENAILASGGSVLILSDMTITRASGDSTGGDNSSFYGVGAAILTTEGTTYIADTTIESDAAGGAGIFSYGNGITYVADTVITTEQDTSGGIHVAGGGTLYAWDLTVETGGESSAAIRSDRGSGTMVVDGGSYTSNGVGSPAVYSTADIAVNNAALTATASEAICIEGLNSIYLFDCDLSGNMADDSQNDTTWTVTLYQSQSGDSEEGNSTFQMIGGTLMSENGGLFYTTNTESTFLLEDVEITSSDDCEFFLMCTGNANARGWGSTGSNGADCSFTAIDQEMAGDVIWDTISQLDFYITGGSTLTGAVINDESYAGDGGSGYCSIYIDEDSTWVVIGDSTVTNLYNAGTITDADGNSVSIVGTDGTTYVSGSSSYTITVETYSTSADLSGVSTAASFSDFEVEKPDALN